MLQNNKATANPIYFYIVTDRLTNLRQSATTQSMLGRVSLSPFKRVSYLVTGQHFSTLEYYAVNKDGIVTVEAKTSSNSVVTKMSFVG